MIIDLKGRKAVVTGSTAGIGLAIAEGLARAGAAVVINGRTEERVSIALRELRTHFPTADIAGIAADLATEKGSAAFTEQAKDADILVNNLGTAKPKPFYELTDSDWREMFEINVMSGVRMTRHYLPGMTKRGWGRVVFISSESALAIPKEMIDYRDDEDRAASDRERCRRIGRRLGRYRQCGSGRPDTFRNPDQHDEGEGRSRRHNARAGRAEFLDDDAANHAAPALRNHRRGRKHGHLCLFGAGIRDERRRLAR